MAADILDETSGLEDGIALHRQGRFADARTVYERCLESPGDPADAMHLLGVIAHQEGDHRLWSGSSDPRNFTLQCARYYRHIGKQYRFRRVECRIQESRAPT